MARQMFGRRQPEDEAFDELMSGTPSGAAAAASQPRSANIPQVIRDAAQRGPLSPQAKQDAIGGLRQQMQTPGMQAGQDAYRDFDRGSRVPQSQGGLGTAPMQQPLASSGTPTPSSQVSAPAASGLPSLGQYSGSLEGFDAGKLQSGHDSPKYQIGRILSQFAPTPEGLQQALPLLQQLGLADNVNLVGNDKLQFSGNIDPRFEGFNTFDVLRGADAGGLGWQFAGEGGGSGAAAGGNPNMAKMPSSQDPFSQLSQLQMQADQGDTYSQQVLRYLMQELGMQGALGQ